MLKELMLAEPRLTLAVAESVTGGRLQAHVTAHSGASKFFLGGVTTYTIEQKVKLLGVDRATAAAVDCVSAEVARQMAVGACRLFGADLALATTGYAEAYPEQNVTVPHGYYALAHLKNGVATVAREERLEAPGAVRVDAQEYILNAAMAALLDYVAELRERHELPTSNIERPTPKA